MGGTAATDGRVTNDGSPGMQDVRPDGQPDLQSGDTGVVDAPPDSPAVNRCTILQLGTGRQTEDGIIRDFDGDGRLDIITAEADSHTAVFRQTAPRTFADPDVYDFPNLYEFAVEVADLNEDGILDFAVSDGYGQTGLLISGPSGARTLTVMGTNLSTIHHDIAIADFDHDGHLDVVVPVYNSGMLGFYWANGPGTYLPRADQATGKEPIRFSVIDANEDGLPDLAVASFGAASQIHINNGDRTFTSTALYQTSASAGLATGDVNNDGHVDLVFPDSGYKRIVVLLGDGHGGFTQPTGLTTTTQTSPFSAALGDFNHDGNLDVVVGYRNYRQVLIYLGTGDGHFQSGQPTAIAVTQDVTSITAGDIDGDGYDDFVATNQDKGLTVVFGPCP
jgi:hypothetical protein